MEALESSQIDTDILHSPVLHGIKRPLERVFDLLAKIPKVPSTIIVPSVTAEQALTGSDSTIQSSTGGTDPSLGTLTTSTSLASLSSVANIFRIQGLYVSPEMLVDEKIQRLWREKIRDRLDLVLYQNISGRTALPQVMMAGKRRDCLQPYPIITCGNSETKERVVKLLRRQVWLKEVLRSNGIAFCAQVAPILQSAGLIYGFEELSRERDSSGGTYSVGLPRDRVDTASGLPIIVRDPVTDPVRYCTLGGLILLDGVPFGLTAGHSFHSQQGSNSERITNLPQDKEPALDRAASDNSDEPFLEDGDDIFSDNLSISTESATDEHTWNSSQDMSQRLAQSVEWSEPHGVILPSRGSKESKSTKKADGEVPKTYDWALLEWPLQSFRASPNSSVLCNCDGESLVRTISTGSRQGEVQIITTDLGGKRGYLHASPGSLMLDNSVIDVHLITLETSLPLGSSGAWVVLQGELCGFIVATRQDVPWAYMTPIAPILEDIKHDLKIKDIHLSFKDEIQYLAAASKVLDEARRRVSESSPCEMIGGPSNYMHPASNHSRQIELGNVKVLAQTPKDIESIRRSESARRPETDLISGRSSYPGHKFESIQVPLVGGMVASQQRLEPELDVGTLRIELEMPDVHSSIRGDETSVVERSGLRFEPLAAASAVEELPREMSSVPENFAGTSQIYRYDFDLEWRLHNEPETLARTSEPWPYDFDEERGTESEKRPILHGRSFNKMASVYRRLNRRMQAIFLSFSAAILWAFRLPNRLWHRLEVYLLRSEYESREIWKYYRPDRLSTYPHPNFIFRVFKHTWNYIVDVLLNVLYVIGCFPCLLLVRSRHWAVLEDEERLRRQRNESIELLGDIFYPEPRTYVEDRNRTPADELAY